MHALIELLLKIFLWFINFIYLKVVPASNANLVHHDSVIASQSSAVVGKLPLTRKASPMQLPLPNETAEQQRMRASSTGSAGSSGNNSNSGRNKLLQQPPNSRDNASPVSYVSTASSGSNNNNNNIQQVNDFFYIFQKYFCIPTY